MLEKDETLSMLVDMGYTVEEALIAMDKCGASYYVCVCIHTSFLTISSTK